MMKRFLMAIFVLAISGSAVFAADVVKIPAVVSGLGASLEAAGKSVYLVPSLQHCAGGIVTPAEAESAPDSTFCLAADAQPDKAGYLIFISEELRLSGVRSARIRVTAQQLEAARHAGAQGILDSQNPSYATVADQKVIAEKNLKTARSDLAAEKAKNETSWWTYTGLGLAAVLFFLLGRFSKRQAADESLPEADTLRVTPDPQATRRTRAVHPVSEPKPAAEPVSAL